MNEKPSTTQTSTILIVEDEPLLRDAIAEILKFSGFNVFTAENGKAALEVLAHHSVDLVLSDIKMPVMNGVELLKNIKRLYSNPKVMFFSAFSDLTYQDAIEMGACDLLPKPVRLEILVEKIRSQIGASR
jgi:two-component system response regulator CpxR